MANPAGSSDALLILLPDERRSKRDETSVVAALSDRVALRAARLLLRESAATSIPDYS